MRKMIRFLHAKGNTRQRKFIRSLLRAKTLKLSHTRKRLWQQSSVMHKASCWNSFSQVMRQSTQPVTAAHCIDWGMLFDERDREESEMVWPCPTTMGHHIQPGRTNNGYFGLFWTLKRHLYGAAVCEWWWYYVGENLVTGACQDFVANGFIALVYRWSKCLNRGGDQVE